MNTPSDDNALLGLSKSSQENKAHDRLERYERIGSLIKILSSALFVAVVALLAAAAWVNTVRTSVTDNAAAIVAIRTVDIPTLSAKVQSNTDRLNGMDTAAKLKLAADERAGDASKALLQSVIDELKKREPQVEQTKNMWNNLLRGISNKEAFFYEHNYWPPSISDRSSKNEEVAPAMKSPSPSPNSNHR